VGAEKLERVVVPGGKNFLQIVVHSDASGAQLAVGKRVLVSYNTMLLGGVCHW
jgi:hypothetical protein